MLRLMAAVLFLAVAVSAQQAPAAPEAKQIAAQFGPLFQLLPGFPVLTADFDGDGAEDAVVVVTSGSNPLLDEGTYNYKVADPYNGYFGFGDPKLTTKFAVSRDDKPRMLLVVHNWREPKTKYVLLNVPFDKLSVARVLVKKKVYTAVRAEEAYGLKSAVYWDPGKKKWKWQDEGVE
jgi:hypothetical protein